MSVTFSAEGLFPVYTEDGDYALDSPPTANFANTNAREILLRLGYGSADLCGSVDASDFAHALMYARATLRLDEGTETRVDRAPGRATMIDMGRPAGYFADAFERLAEVAAFAASHGLPVVYG